MFFDKTMGKTSTILTSNCALGGVVVLCLTPKSTLVDFIPRALPHWPHPSYGIGQKKDDSIIPFL